MIPVIKKNLAFLLAVLLPLSLYNTLTVFAAESALIPASSTQSEGEAAVSTSSTEESSVESGEPEQTEQKLSAAGEQVEVESQDVSTLVEDGVVWKKAATIDELYSLLGDTEWLSTGGHIQITADLVVPANKTYMFWPDTSENTSLVVDLGPHTLYVEGWLKSLGPIKYIGAGGENGLIHVRAGGKANIRSATFAVTEAGGYAIWQENRSSLTYEHVNGSVGEVHFAQALEGEASTFEELMLLLDDEYWQSTGGQITVTNDLVVPAGEEHKIGWLSSKALTTLDMGQHTLFIEGTLGIYEKVKIIGEGGKNGLVHIRTGGAASIWPAALIAKEDGYAIWQEECSLFEYSPNENIVGKVHCAERPVAVPLSTISPDVGIPVAVIHDGETLEDVLPVTDSVRLYWQGDMVQGTFDEDKRIPVVWDLEPYKAQLDARERVLITGSYPEAEAFEAPVCLVVFENGNPAVFLNSYGAETHGHPAAIVDMELAKPELGCRFEWSQDGETWLPAQCKVSSTDEPLRFMVTFSQGEAPVYPYYLSAVVNYPDGGMGYSDVIVFTGAKKWCGSGGNRGGGTDITDPPIVLEPSPDPPDNASDNEGERPNSNPTPEPAPPNQPDTPPESASPNQPDTTPEPASPNQPDTPPESASPNQPDTTPESAPSNQPDTTPEPAPPGQSNTTPSPAIKSSGQSDITSAQGEPEMPGVASEPESTIQPSKEPSAIGENVPPARDGVELQGSPQILSETEGEASNSKQDDTVDGISKPVDSVMPNLEENTVIVEAMSTQSDNEGGNPLVKAVPIVVGGTATAAVIGVAGIYHSESLRKRLQAALKRFIRRKK